MNNGTKFAHVPMRLQKVGLLVAPVQAHGKALQNAAAGSSVLSGIYSHPRKSSAFNFRTHWTDECMITQAANAHMNEHESDAVYILYTKNAVHLGGA